ncbi:MAG: DUF4234 domain-containing protein [Polyangiaceae bacterium]|nr:DUF4234 domain-containing protein [Polyangiaceae bacterium]
MYGTQRLSPRFRVDIVLGVVFTVITCGIYNIFWNKKQFEAMNTLLGREEYNFWLWLGVSFITCGLFHIYYQYKFGTDLDAFLRAQGGTTETHFGMLGLLLSLFGLSVIADAIFQQEFNKLTG